jgi:hypothetical protein
MTAPFQDTSFDEDLRCLMAVAILCGHKGVPAQIRPIYEAWAAAYPTDALGPIGIGLALVAEGQGREGYRMIAEAARAAQTRAEQAREVLARLEVDMPALVE